MYKVHNVRSGTDARRLMFALAAAAVMVSIAFAITASDSSDAEQEDGKSYFYNKFDDFQKSVYDAAIGATVEETIKDGNTVYIAEFSVPVGEYGGLDKDMYSGTINGKISQVIQQLAREKVEMFWIQGTYSISTPHYDGLIASGEDFTIFLNSIYSPAQIAQYTAELETKVNEIKATLPNTSNRYSIAESIHDYLCNTLEYIAHDSEHPIPPTMDIRNVATALVGDHIVVCEGYAKAFKYLCDEYNIPCIIVTGKGVTQNGAEGHMWNYIQMDNDSWYLVDCTWDDQSSVRYEYFLAGSESEGFNHKLVKEDHMVDTDYYANLPLPDLSTAEFSKIAVTIEYDNAEGHQTKVLSMSAGDTLRASQLSKYAKDYKTNTDVYTFASWYGFTDGMTVGSDMTITATYSSVPREYSVVFKDYNSQILHTEEGYHYGDKIVSGEHVLPADPSRDPDKYYDYTFDAWTIKDWDRPVGDYVVDRDGIVVFASYTKERAIAHEGDMYTINAENNSITFTSDELNTVQSGDNSLTVVLPRATFVFTNDAVDGFDADQTLSVKVLSTTALDASLRDSLNKATVFDIDFGTNNSKTGTVTVAINWEVKSWQKAEDLEVYYINGDTKTLLESTYDDANEQIVFKVNHFSVYAVDSDSDLLTSIIDMLYENYVIVIIVLLALLSFAVIYKFS